MVTVLVVDDSHTSREMLTDLLKQQGIEVIQAIDGLDAQTQLASATPNVVITDLIMPNMNGYELCRWIKKNERTKHIPVVICSTKDEEFDRYWGMKQGADAYIPKPFNATDMLATLKKLLSSKS
ncbi:response regulator [Merismopedia glauca]|uniref:Two-component system response regulator n=1 Tax=Merismopedia glauca CCAP 1448/3 TaxID=1296344 RepID=A0A2T1C2K1_9CYAN|nr:response regulator [Merismopedia glauca]PSB02491.1 two-component system response regulator [Merismopedia glauca CCAP 1448/3]